MNDAHVHMGYFPRLGKEKPYYYSPRRVLGALDRAGVDEFIVSSTNAVWDETGTAMHREAKEMKRLAGVRAHIFFWVSERYLAHDKDLECLPEGLYEGFKLHGGETQWLKRPDELRCVLAIANERGFKVQIHTGYDNPKSEYVSFCREFPNIHFDLAHCRDPEEAITALDAADNIYVDTAFAPQECVTKLIQRVSGTPLAERILFGSDIPAPQRYDKTSMTAWIKQAWKVVHDGTHLDVNFKMFLSN